MCLLNLAILVLLYMPNSSNIMTIAGTFTAGTAFNSIIYFYY